jgi:hypothetical protein
LAWLRFLIFFSFEGARYPFGVVDLMLSLSLAIALIRLRGRRRPAGGESLFLSRQEKGPKEGDPVIGENPSQWQ